MNSLRLRSSKDMATPTDRLASIRERLMERGEKEENANKPSIYAEAAEAGIVAIFESIPEIVCDALDVLEDPPHTWDRYIAMHEGKKIYEMEFGELREAIKRDLKNSKSELHVRKELSHVMAAALYIALID